MLSGNFLLTLVEFLVVLGLLLFFHEFGHFFVARLLKIEVEEFGFGFPPRLAKLFTIGHTDFTVNWIPFGAFVRPKGENDPEVPGGLASASPWARLAVLLGGPAMNLLVGLILFSVMFMRIGAPVTNVVEIVEVSPDSPAMSAGLQVGDVIKQIDGIVIDRIETLQRIVQSNLGKTLQVIVDRKGQSVQAQVATRANPPEGQGPVGIAMGNPYKPVSIIQAFPIAGLTAIDQAKQLFIMPVRLIQGKASSQETRVVGPVGMFDIYAEAVRRDAQAAATPLMPAVNVLWFVGTISVALGLTNLLPIPALDGGRIIFVIPELLIRRRIPAQYENLVHLIGFAALLLLMGYITIQDFAHPIITP